MKFLDILQNSLFNPAKVFAYKMKPMFTVFYFFFLAFIIIIPDLIVQTSNPILSYSEQVEIRSAFDNHEALPFTIKNGVLVNQATAKQDFYLIETKMYNIYFSTNNEILKTSKINEYYLIFLEDGIYFVMADQTFLICNYSDHPGFEGLNFFNARLNNDEFWNPFFQAVNYSAYNFYANYIIVSVFAIIIRSMFYILIFSLGITVFNRLGGANLRKFSEHLTYVIFFMTPYAALSLIGILLGLELLTYVGLLITIFYAHKINIPGGLQ